MARYRPVGLLAAMLRRMRRVAVAVAVVSVAVAGAAWWIRGAPHRVGELLPADVPAGKPVALVVRLVDAVTGEPVLGGEVHEGTDSAPLVPDGESFRRDVSSLRRSEWACLAVCTANVPGHVDASEVVNALIGTFTDIAELTILVVPAVDLELDVRDADGKPVEGAVVWSGRVDDRSVPGMTSTSDARGWAVLRGVPFVPGARVRVAVRHGDAWGSGETRFGTKPQPGTVPVTVGTSRIDGDLIYAQGGGTGGRARVPHDAVRPDGDADVSVTLVSSDGAPHAGVALALTGFTMSVGYWRIDGTTDAAGRVDFRGAIAGPCEIKAYGRGIQPEDREVVAVANDTVQVMLRESTLLSTVVTVLDADGLPMFGAAVHASAQRDDRGGGAERTCVEETEGVQQLVPRCDADGRVRLTGLPAGRIAVYAGLGALSGSATVVAGEDVTIRFASKSR